jgi:flagellar hook-basal body complex protein FliE
MQELNPLQFGAPKEIEINPTPQISTGATTGPNGSSFKDMFNGFLQDVNGMQLKADESIQKMVSGEIKDVHQVMLAVGEAKVAFNLLLEIRNKTMEAYQEILKMRG